MRRLDNRGFTIIELLIATVVFSLILLIITGAIIQINRVYYKGVVNTKTQEITRGIMDEIAKDIQYSKGGVTTNLNGDLGEICISGRSYKFQKKQLVTSGPSATHALVRADGCANVAPAAPLAIGNGTELLAENMHVADISVNSVGSLYLVHVTVGYGPYGDITYSTDPYTGGLIGRCQAIKLGGQFCAVANYTTHITKRQ